MSDKNQVKKEIDEMPDEWVEKVHSFIAALKKQNRHRKALHTFKLGGAFDHKHIREKAYE
ncbi:MAG: hypothetical protein ACQERN_11690 [Thermodesulfobacteriota bacterium]